MRVLYVLMALIQFSFAFHAVKTGRGCMWVTLIIVFPVIGCLAYYFLEVFPNSSEERTLRRRMRALAKTMSPDAELQQRARELAINPASRTAASSPRSWPGAACTTMPCGSTKAAWKAPMRATRGC